MDLILENGFLKVTLTTWGAQVKSVIRKSDGTEHIWKADPAVWGYHAPILFPHTGKLKDGTMIVKGQTITGCKQHGFARLMEHTPVLCGESQAEFELTETPQTLELWPYRFRLLSTFTLEGDTLHHTLTVENQDEEEMPFGIGYHPAFTVPFDDKHTMDDYELRFDSLQSPVCLEQVAGLIGQKHYYLGKNIRSIDIDEHLFDNDSHCMTGLQAKTLGLYEKDTGRGVVCNIEKFPYVLIWSKPGVPQFVCIEPWNSLPSPTDCDCRWEHKPAAAILAPGTRWSTTLSMSFVR